MSDTPIPPSGDEVEGPPPPDYSRLGFRELQRLVKARGLNAEGKSVDLIEKLKAFDAEHGLDVNTEVPAGAEDDDEVDLLADDLNDSATRHTPDKAAQEATPAEPLTHIQTTGGGGDASPAPPPATTPETDTPAPVGVGPATPAVAVVSDPDAPKGLPPAYIRSRPNMAVRDGVVKVGEGHGAAEVRAFRRQFVIGPRDIGDSEHVKYIEDTHAAAHAAGYETKGGITVGERIGYATDAAGMRTAVYQVPLRRQR